MLTSPPFQTFPVTDPFNNGSVGLVSPVQVHLAGLRLGLSSLGKEMDKRLASITLPSLAAVRDFANLSLVDGLAFTQDRQVWRTSERLLRLKSFFCLIVASAVCSVSWQAVFCTCCQFSKPQAGAGENYHHYGSKSGDRSQQVQGLPPALPGPDLPLGPLARRRAIATLDAASESL